MQVKLHSKFEILFSSEETIQQLLRYIFILQVQQDVRVWLPMLQAAQGPTILELKFQQRVRPRRNEPHRVYARKCSPESLISRNPRANQHRHYFRNCVALAWSVPFSRRSHNLGGQAK